MFLEPFPSFGVELRAMPFPKARCLNSNTVLREGVFYDVIHDDEAAQQGHIRIRNKSNGHHIYPSTWFHVVNNPEELLADHIRQVIGEGEDLYVEDWVRFLDYYTAEIRQKVIEDLTVYPERPPSAEKVNDQVELTLYAHAKRLANLLFSMKP